MGKSCATTAGNDGSQSHAESLSDSDFGRRGRANTSPQYCPIRVLLIELLKECSSILANQIVATFGMENDELAVMRRLQLGAKLFIERIGLRCIELRLTTKHRSILPQCSSVGTN